MVSTAGLSGEPPLPNGDSYQNILIKRNPVKPKPVKASFSRNPLKTKPIFWTSISPTGGGEGHPLRITATPATEFPLPTHHGPQLRRRRGPGAAAAHLPCSSRNGTWAPRVTPPMVRSHARRSAVQLRNGPHPAPAALPVRRRPRCRGEVGNVGRQTSGRSEGGRRVSEAPASRSSKGPGHVPLQSQPVRRRRRAERGPPRQARRYDGRARAPPPAAGGTTGETRCPCQALRLQVIAARAGRSTVENAVGRAAAGLAVGHAAGRPPGSRTRI